MYQVYNCMLDDSNGKMPYNFSALTEQQVEDIYDRLQLPLPLQRQDNEEAEARVDYRRTRMSIRQSVGLSWHPNIPMHLLKTLSRDDKKALITAGIEEFFEVWANAQLGFKDLKPGETANLAKDPRLAQSLLQSNIVANLIITDLDTNTVIWKPEWKEIEVEEARTIKDYQEGRTVKSKRKILVNALHPDKERQFFTKEMEEQYLAQESEKVKNTK